MVKRQRFTAEFKREAVRLLDAGERPASELAIDLGVTEERDFLKKNGSVLREGAAMKYDFVRCYADEFSLAALCRVLSVSRSGYYAWCRREPSARQREDLPANGVRFTS